MLKKNKTLTERNELLEEQVEHIREEVRSRGGGATGEVQGEGKGPIRKGPRGLAQALSPELPALEWPPRHTTLLFTVPPPAMGLVSHVVR